MQKYVLRFGLVVGFSRSTPQAAQPKTPTLIIRLRAQSLPRRSVRRAWKAFIKMSFMRRVLPLCCTVLLLAGAFPSLAANLRLSARPLSESQPVLPAEFERQDAMLLSWNRDDAKVRRVLIDLVGAIANRVTVLMLVDDERDYQDASRSLARAGVPDQNIRFLPITSDTIWARDYGPAVLRGADGVPRLVDFDYERGGRPNDDNVPRGISSQLSMETLAAPLTIEGGNILSNGAGLCLTTFKVLDANADRRYRPDDVADELNVHFGAQKVVFLEPLKGEPTGHLDMFVTFVAADTVVIGEYAPHVDPVNAEILDRNADLLSGVMTPNGPLKVVRIPMPPHDDGSWRTYTNVVYANGTLVIPVYPGFDNEGRERAVSTFRQILPRWEVVEIDCNGVIDLGGALHCLTRNLTSVARVPTIDENPFARSRHQLPAVNDQRPRLLLSNDQSQKFLPPVQKERERFQMPASHIPASDLNSNGEQQQIRQVGSRAWRSFSDDRKSMWSAEPDDREWEPVSQPSGGY